MADYSPITDRRRFGRPPLAPAVLVIGGGIGGMRAALDLADAGMKVYLVEQSPCLGGRVAQLGFMFPQHDCVLCRGTPDHGYGCTRPSISPAFITANQHPNIECLTSTHVVDVAGQAGEFSVSLRQEPRYIEADRCINCGYCAEVCPVELPDEYQRGLSMRKAVYKVAARAMPDAYVVDRGLYCDACQECIKVCPTQAIDLHQQPRLLAVEVAAIILALGFQVYDPSGMDELGFGRYSNVINAMQYERLASRSGPTEGLVLRPSDGKAPRSIAWLQCIGSRDQTNAYCSSICCMYATKEAILARQRLGKSVECSVFMLDERAFNKEYSAYFNHARQEHDIEYVRCRISGIRQEPGSNDLILQYSNPDEESAGGVKEGRFGLVVLATGLQPPVGARSLAKLLDIELNEFGFCQTDKFTPLQTTRPGVFVCGAFSSPKEIVETVLDGSGAAAEVLRSYNLREANSIVNSAQFTRQYPFLSRNDFPPERDIISEQARVGVFACRCGGVISDKLNLPALVEQAAGWSAVALAEVVDLACFPEGLERIKAQIEAHNLNRLVIAGCSNRTHDPLFQRLARQSGLNPYLVDLVNIKEQCSRVHRGHPVLANRKAVEMVRMAVGRTQVTQPVYKKKHRCRPSALVLGGGVSGMTAALAVADSGFDVHLVERAEALGGNLHNLHYVAEGYNPQRLMRDLVNRVRSHKNIAVHTRSELIHQEGHVGFFRSDLTTQRPGRADEFFNIEHGVTIVATGGREAREHPWLAYAGVITQSELEARIIHRPEEIAALKHVVMVQCVEIEGVPHYCSRVCCTNTMKNAIRLKLFNPGCQVTVLYKNIVTYGFREKYYTEARRHGVIFIRYTDEEPPQLIAGRGSRQAAAPLVVVVRDPALGLHLELPADLIPLSMPVLPAEGSQALAGLMKVPISSEGFFQEAQLKLRPMDFMREGVFLAGMAHYPKFIEESISHALAAAGRAISLLSWESLYLGGVVAEVDPEKCVGCLTCTRTCPFGIPQVIQTEGRYGVGRLGGAAFIDSAQCQGCGTCTGECPANAIQLVNYTDEQVMLRHIGGLGLWQTTGVN